MISWKTTLGGIVASIGTMLASSELPENWWWVKILGTMLASGGSLLMGLSARDQGVTSEQAGLRPVARKEE